MKFSALNVDFSSPSRDPQVARPVQAVVKDGYPLKMVILPQLSRVAWKRLQIGSDMMLIITSINVKLFIGVNADELEWPLTPKIGFLVNFFGDFRLRHTFLEWICTEMAEDGPGQPAYDIFIIKRTCSRISSLKFKESSVRRPQI